MTRRLVVLALALLAVGGILQSPHLWAAYRERRLSRLTLTRLEELAKARPEDVAAHYYLGRAYARASADDRAAREFLTVVRLEPAHARAFNDLGVLLMAHGKHRDALIALQAAVQAEPLDAATFARLGRLYLALNRPYDAVDRLTRAVKLDARDALIFADLGMAYRKTWDFQSALDAYRSAARLAPDNPEVWSGMGETCRSLARYEEAEEAFRQALRCSPRHPAALAGLGRIEFERARSREDLRRADQLFRESIASDPRNPDTLYYRGFLQRKLGDEGEAVRVLERALALSPSHTGALYQLGRAYVALGRTEDGNRLLQRFRGVEALQREREIRAKRREAP